MHCKELSKAMHFFLLFLLNAMMAYRNRLLTLFSSHLKIAGFDVNWESIGVIKNGQKRF